MEEDKNNSNVNLKLTFAIIGANLLITLVYQVVLLRDNMNGYMLSAIVLYLHAIALGLTSTMLSQTKYRYFAPGLGISIPLVLLIGYGTCRMF